MPRIEQVGNLSAVTVPASGDTDLVTIQNGDKSLLCFHASVATQALDAFKVLVKAADGAALVDITPSNWASLTSGQRFLYANGNLAAQAAGTVGYFEMDITGLAEITVRASAAVNNASVTCYYSVT